MLPEFCAYQRAGLPPCSRVLREIERTVGVCGYLWPHLRSTPELTYPVVRVGCLRRCRSGSHAIPIAA